jgi:hypothetical protein
VSKLKVTTISDPDNDNTAITVDSSGNVTFAQDATFSGSVTGISSDLVDDTTPQLGGNLDTNSYGIYLGGTAAANLLDDYEEGTWTVTWNGLSGTPSNTTAYYRKIGGIVYWVYNTGASSISATANSTNITGFPFSGQYASTGVGISSGTGSANTGMFYLGGSPAFWMTSFSSGGNQMTYSGFYFTAA